MENTSRNLINGNWVTASRTTPNISPSDTTDIVGDFASADMDAANEAIHSAKAALADWSETSPQVRADALDTIGTEIVSRKDEIGHLLSREEGKTLQEGISEAQRAGQIFKFFAQEALRIAGDSIASVRPNVDVEVTREPVGVVGIITPWNFPIAIPAWKIAPALAYGNTVVFKPAELTPACAFTLAEIIDRAGLNPGVFNLVIGSGSRVGQAFIDHSSIDAISFTGSVQIGKKIAIAAAANNTKYQLEMGGKNPMVVMSDADMDRAVDVCLNGAFFSTGQRCTASSRLVVHEAIYDEFLEKLTTAMLGLTVGHALSSDTQIGPVVSAPQLQSNLEYIQLARNEGAEVIGGERLYLENEGFYQSPALFVGANNQMRIAREEIFGPCAAVIKVGNFDEAVAVANDTEFGLSSGICTSSLTFAREFKKRSEAGMVMVNLPTAGVDYHVPFGGRKGSSYGPREQGRFALEFYTSVKTAYTSV